MEGQGPTLTCNDFKLVEIIMFGDTLFNHFDYNRILNTAITFIVSSKQFDETLFSSN